MRTLAAIGLAAALSAAATGGHGVLARIAVGKRGYQLPPLR